MNKFQIYSNPETAEKRITELEKEVERLRAALEKYGAHKPECQRDRNITRVHHIGDESRFLPCTCGLEQALKGEE